MSKLALLHKINYEITQTLMNRTKIKGHKQDGKKLLPPLHGYGKSSWANERLPQMLWATLLIANLPREHALHIFRKVTECFMTTPLDDDFPDLTHYGLANMPTKRAVAIIQKATTDEAAKAVLSSLLIYDELPVKELWASAIGEVRISNPDELLMRAVGTTLWHQTQEATDCRWLRILPLVVTGRMKMPEKQFDEFVNYPNKGDMTEIRPIIRCEELSLDGFEQHIGHNKKFEAWTNSFWAQNLRYFPCFPLLREESAARVQLGTTL